MLFIWLSMGIEPLRILENDVEDNCDAKGIDIGSLDTCCNISDGISTVDNVGGSLPTLISQCVEWIISKVE